MTGSRIQCLFALYQIDPVLLMAALSLGLLFRVFYIFRGNKTSGEIFPFKACGLDCKIRGSCKFNNKLDQWITFHPVIIGFLPSAFHPIAECFILILPHGHAEEGIRILIGDMNCFFFQVITV